jgi:hypothetical protein
MPTTIAIMLRQIPKLVYRALNISCGVGIEDIAMEQAIAEGEATKRVSRESIFQLLEPET